MNLDNNSHLEGVADEATDAVVTQNRPRRDLIVKTGLAAGLALLGGRFAAHAAEAMPNQNMPGMSGEMPAQMVGSAMINAPMTNRNEMGMPTTAVVENAETPSAKEQNDAAILNYALALEYLEADYYNRVVQADTMRSYLRGRVRDLSRVLMRDENTHVAAVSDVIRKLGGTPIAKPTFVFPANAFVSQIGFLVLSSQLEETGVSAYLGQGANVRRKDVLNFAASIYGNEARHSGLIRYHLGSSPAPRDSEMPLPMADILQRVRPFFADGAVLDGMMQNMMPGMMNPAMTPPK